MKVQDVKAWVSKVWNANDGVGNQNEIQFLDVKDLYDRAYEEREKARVALKESRQLFEQAIKMDEAYRRQLNTKAYKQAA